MFNVNAWTLIRRVSPAGIQATVQHGEPTASAPGVCVTDVLHFRLHTGLFREGLHYESPRGRREDWTTERTHV